MGTSKMKTHLGMALAIVVFIGCQGSVPTQTQEPETRLEVVQATVRKAIDPGIDRKFTPRDIAPKNERVVTEPRREAKSLRRRHLPDPSQDPFQPGDVLTYDIYYLGVKAGNVVFSVLPFQEIMGRKAYHFKSEIESSRMLKWVYRISTRSETLMDYEDLYSHRFELSFEDRRQTKHYVELHDQRKHVSHLWAKRISRELGDQERNEKSTIKPMIQDGLSSIAFAAFLPLAPQTEFTFPAFTEGKPWTAKLVVADLEPYRHPEMGLIQALRVEPKRIWDKPGDAPAHASQLDFVAWVLPKSRRLAAVELRSKYGLIRVILKSFRRAGMELDTANL